MEGTPVRGRMKVLARRRGSLIAEVRAGGREVGWEGGREGGTGGHMIEERETGARSTSAGREKDK
jgi:hypothetical protein